VVAGVVKVAKGVVVFFLVWYLATFLDRVFNVEVVAHKNFQLLDRLSLVYVFFDRSQFLVIYQIFKTLMTIKSGKRRKVSI
jgi:hypothetical protein